MYSKLALFRKLTTRWNPAHVNQSILAWAFRGELG